jgi:glycerol uptake facilitator protein
MSWDWNIVLAEIFGTGMLILLGDGVVAGVLLSKTKSNQTEGVGMSNGWIVITVAWAFAVFCGVVIAGPISGAHLNPAVTLGLAMSGGITWGQVPEYLVGEMVGAMIGAALVLLHYWDHFKATEDKELKRAVFCNIPAIRNYRLNFLSEVVGTFVLVFMVFAITWNKVGAGAAGGSVTPVGLGSIGALPVAFVVLVIGLSLGGTTGYAINPARDLGPRIIHAILPVPGKGGSDWEYSWVPVLGPLVGAVVAWGVYNFVWVDVILKNVKVFGA